MTEIPEPKPINKLERCPSSDEVREHAYRDRKTKKRIFRSLWITRINAAARLNGTTYSKLINALDIKGVNINRKVLASMALENPAAFTEVVKFCVN